MTNNELVALFASIGACMSAVATFLTVLQIAKQRNASYRPELALSSVYLECTKDSIVKGQIPTLWTAKSNDSKTNPQSRSFSLPLRNVGLGTAKSVSISFSFPFETITRQVNELAQKSLSAAYFTFEEESLSIDSQDLGKSTSMWMNQKQVTIDYVLPASVEHEAVLLNIPHAYIQIVSSLLYFSSKHSGISQFPEIPPLIAHLEYSDIGETKHNSTLSIQFQLSAIGGNGEFISGYLESKKVA